MGCGGHSRPLARSPREVDRPRTQAPDAPRRRPAAQSRAAAAKGQPAKDSSSISYLLSEIAVHRRDFQDELARTIPRSALPTSQRRSSASKLSGSSLTSGSPRPIESRWRHQQDDASGRPALQSQPGRRGRLPGILGHGHPQSPLSKRGRHLPTLERLGPPGRALQSPKLRLWRCRSTRPHPSSRELGRAIRLTSRSLQDEAGSNRSDLSAAGWGLIAVTLDPTQIPQPTPINVCSLKNRGNSTAGSPSSPPIGCSTAGTSASPPPAVNCPQPLCGNRPARR